MFSRILEYFADPTDVRSAAAIAVGVLATIFHPGNSAAVVAVVDAAAGVVVAIDQYFLHRKSSSA